MDNKATPDTNTYSNPRYVAYAKAHGKTPDEMMSHDAKVWPGGVMCGFTIWISQQKVLFYNSNPECFLDPYTIYDQEAWTAWLEAAARAA